MAKTYKVEREFDAESEPVMGSHESLILAIISVHQQMVSLVKT